MKRDTEITNSESTSLDSETSDCCTDCIVKVVKGDKSSSMESEPPKCSKMESENGASVCVAEVDDDEKVTPVDTGPSLVKFATHVRNTSEDDPVLNTENNERHKVARETVKVEGVEASLTRVESEVETLLSLKEEKETPSLDVGTESGGSDTST